MGKFIGAFIHFQQVWGTISQVPRVVCSGSG